MHPKAASLMAYSDAQFDAERSRRIVGHLRTCEKCRAELDRIGHEKKRLAPVAPGLPPSFDVKRGLAAVLAAIAGLEEAAAPELRTRVREQIETYFGAGAASLFERPGMPSTEMLAKTLALVATFLGRDAAEAVVDDVVRGLDCAGLSAEIAQ
jgi:anti-sigma factor RsiW